MTAPRLPAVLLGAALATVTLVSLGARPVQDMPDMSPEDMAAMMEKVMAYTQPGEHHARLGKLVGEWETETRMTMGAGAPAEPGRSTISWLFDGRWLKIEGSGSMMGMPMRSFMIMGYDNFKMSYVTTAVNTMDTAMNRSEGDFTRDGKALISYGTLDEYLTGEHDKMVKYAWRFPSDDEMVLEVHDLHIGEQDAMVLETRFRRVR